MPMEKRPAKKTGRRRPVWRYAAIGLAIVVVLLIGVWFLGPPLIGAVARPIVERRANAQIDGTVSIERLNLAWTGVQRAGPVELFDTDGTRIARVEAEVGVGLLRLAAGGRDLGDVIIGGRADLVRLDDGRLNIVRALGPLLENDDQNETEASIPPALRARLSLDGVEVTYADPGQSPGRMVGLRGITGSTVIRAGEPLSLTLTARPVRGSSIETLTPGVGSIELTAEAGSWSATDGRITADALNLTAIARAQRLETAFLRVLLPLGGEAAAQAGERALAAFDPVFDLAATVELSAQRLEADARLLAEGAEIGAGIRMAGGVIEIAGPTGARIRGDRVLAAAPEIAEALAERADTITLDEFPSLELTVDSLRLDLATPWSFPRAEVRVRTGALRGTIMPPASERMAFSFTGLSADAALAEQGDLAATVRAGAELAGREAGSLDADLRAGRVVSPDGFGIDPTAITGRAGVSGLKTDLLEVFLGELGTTIAAAIGPELNLNLSAGAESEGGREIAIRVAADRLSGEGGVLLMEDRIVGAGEPITLNASGGADLVSALAGEQIGAAGFELFQAGEGGLSVTLSSIEVPLDLDDLDALLIAGEADLQGWRLRDGDGRELDAESLKLAINAGAAQPGAVELVLDSRLRAEGRSFGLNAQVGLGREQLLQAMRAEGPMPSLLPMFRGIVRGGSVELSDAPVALIAMAPIEVVDALGERVDAAALARDLVGQTVTARAAIEPGAEGRRGMLAAITQELDLRLDSALDRDGSPTSAILELTLRPETTRTLLDRFAPEMAVRPELAAATRLRFEAEPTTFPIGSGALALRASGAAAFRPLVIAREDGDPIDTGPLEVRDLSLTARLPAGWNEGEGIAFEQAALAGRLQRPGGRRLGSFDASALTEAGRINLAVDASDLDAPWLDSLAGLEGLLSSTLGGPARLTLRTSTPALATIAEDGEVAIGIESPRVRTPNPVRLKYTPQTLSIAAPARINWDGQAAEANALLAGLGATRPWFADRLRLEADIASMTIPRGDRSLLDPEVFAASVQVRAPFLAIDTGAGVRRLGGSEFGLNTGPDKPGRMDFSAAFIERASGPGRAELTGSLANFAPGGVFAIDGAALDLRAEVSRFPIALIDDLTVGTGLLAEILGPEISGQIRTAALSRDGGTLGGDLSSDRASVSLDGRVRAGAFTLTRPAELAITRFGPDLMARASSVMPLIGTVEKRADDQPASVRVSSVSVPLDGNLSNLDAAFTVDLGSATFTAAPAFQGLLRAARWDARGAAAQQVAPVELSIARGILEFGRFDAPIAGGRVSAQGRIDLGRRTRDIVIMLPLEALSQSMADRVRREAGPLGAAADTLTSIPFRIDGPLDAPPNPRPDLQLLIEEGARDLLNPDNVIRNIFDEILRPRREGN